MADSIHNTIQMFMKRLHEVSSSGGSIAADPVVLSLYQNLTAMQPQLLKQIDDIQQQKGKLLSHVTFSSSLCLASAHYKMIHLLLKVISTCY